MPLGPYLGAVDWRTWGIVLVAALAASCGSEASSIGQLTPTLPEIPVSQTAQWGDIAVSGPLVERFGDLVLEQGPESWAHLPTPANNTRWFLATDDGCLEVSREDFVAEADRDHIEVRGVGAVLDSNPLGLSAHDLFVHDGCATD